MILPPAVTARGLGEEGFVEYLHRVHGFGIVDRDELLVWLRLHGAVMRATLPPLDDGMGLDEQELGALARELGGELEEPSA